MTHRHATPKVVGYCFVHCDGDSYVGYVSVQQDHFYGVAHPTHHAAMREAREIVAMLFQERVITESVCACHGLPLTRER